MRRGATEPAGPPLRPATKGEAGGCCVCQPCNCPSIRRLPCAHLCRLLATVPEADMAQARRVVDAIGRLDEEAAEEAVSSDAAALAKLL